MRLRAPVLARLLLSSFMTLAVPVVAGAQGGQGPGLFGQPQTSVQSPILTIESERLFTDSAFGRRVSAQIEAEGALIGAQNREIEAMLTSEERALTDRRAAMAPEAFRDLANAFDEKVQRLRREQEVKARALGQQSDVARRQFLEQAQPVLEAIMRSTGAAVIIERRSVFLAADVIDVTDQVVTDIDAAIGDGSGLAPPVVMPASPAPDAAAPLDEQPAEPIAAPAD